MSVLQEILKRRAVRSDSHRGLTWGKVGETPVVTDSDGRFGLNVISGTIPRGDVKFSFINGKMNSKRFIEFLKQLRGDTGQPIIVAFLPAYSPELNPGERVRNHAKARLAKLPIASKELIKKRLLQ